MFKFKKKEFAFTLLKEEDVETCIKMIKTSAKGVKWRDEFLRNLLLNKSTIGFIARKDGKEVGVIIGSILVNPVINFVCITDRESLMKGLDGMLIDEFIKEVKRRQPRAPHVTVSLAAEDTHAVALYSWKGFVIEGFVKRGLHNRDMVLMRRDLTH